MNEASARLGLVGPAVRSAAQWIVHALTLTAAAGVAAVAQSDEGLFDRLDAKDGPEGAGVFENLTVVLLVPAIGAGLAAAWRGWSRLGQRWVCAWLICWALACVYFAGEEISWGQRYFGWETPQPLAEINDQGETNLHNISSWLDQKPRMLVELFIIGAGLLVPVGLRLFRREPTSNHPVFWIVAPSLCWSAAAAFMILRLLPDVEGTALERLAGSELRELAIAWFLLLYLSSYLIRTLPAKVGASQRTRDSALPHP